MQSATPPGTALPGPGRPWRTRFAPAPTGYLHLGHLVNAMHVWGMARARGGVVVLRIEDHDRTRCRPEFEAALLEDLDWLGLHPDEGSLASFAADRVTHPLRQSNNPARYERALSQLGDRVFACACTRRDIDARVPHQPGEEPRYPGTCRARALSPAVTLARRVRLDDTVETFDDVRLGTLSQQPMAQCGDVLVRDRHGSWTYQFAVTVDDLVHGIDVVIRGEDLLASTGRQIALARLLGRHDPPRFLHHMLLRHADGAKLSKATRDTALREHRAHGTSPEMLFGLAAYRAGLVNTPAPLPLDAIPALFTAR
jgi:glutamyl/glutaminyl-tRNA synthetase